MNIHSKTVMDYQIINNYLRNRLRQKSHICHKGF